MNGELLLTILSSVAQQESLNLSSHVNLGLKVKTVLNYEEAIKELTKKEIAYYYIGKMEVLLLFFVVGLHFIFKLIYF